MENQTVAVASSPNLLQLWSKRFDQFNAGSLTVQQFCVTVDCSVATFYYWKNKLERMSLADSSESIRHGEALSAESTPGDSSARLVGASVSGKPIQHLSSHQQASSRVGAMRGESSAEDAGRVSAFVPVVVQRAEKFGGKRICVRLDDGTKVTVPVDALEALQVVLQHASRVAS